MQNFPIEPGENIEQYFERVLKTIHLKKKGNKK